MRARPIACLLVIGGLALLPLACSDVDAASSGGATTTVAHADHAGNGSGEDAPATTEAPPTRLDIVASEYAWSGLPDTLPAGTYPMSFRNVGAEPHEISIFRNTDGLSLDELFALGPVGIKDAVDMVGTLIAGPGTPADQELSITLTPGEYEVVCFMPAASDGQPHFHHGMHTKLDVR